MFATYTPNVLDKTKILLWVNSFLNSNAGAPIGIPNALASFQHARSDFIIEAYLSSYTFL
jgi:hypothetical protein